jgi:hypothetical protein
MIEPPTREELVLDIIAVRKALSHLRHDLHVARELAWAAHLVGKPLSGKDILDIIGWPIEAEGLPEVERK